MLHVAHIAKVFHVKHFIDFLKPFQRKNLLYYDVRYKSIIK